MTATPTPTPSAEAPYAVTAHLEELLARRDLHPEAARELMEAIIAGRVSGVSIAALVMALRAKGESVVELAEFARVMRARAVPVRAPEGTIDTCGTGGDRSLTFNISTATALVTAGMGIPVAKHGGRSVSSSTGSADVLKELGVNVDAAPPCIERCIAEAGIGFMFAPLHHPGMKHVAPVRRELGVRTVFNLLGPLSNPASARLQVLGVFQPSLCETFARVLKDLGSARAMVVCGAGAEAGGHLDEISTFGPTTIGKLANGSVTVETFDPRSCGIELATAEALRADSVSASAALIRRVLDGQRSPARDIVLLNAAAAALVAEKATDWVGALKLAVESVDSGRARRALELLVQCSRT